MYVAGKDAGEKQTFRLTLLLRFLPYYLTSNLCPIPDYASGLPRNYGYVIRRKAKIRKNPSASLIYLYHIFYINVKENFLEFKIFQLFLPESPKKAT